MSQPTPDETLLGLLAARPQHGYQLLEVFRNPDHLGEVWHLSTSQLYAVLKRLETQGLISGREIASLDAPVRTEYSLTEDGRRHLQQWLDAKPSASVRRVRVEFLSRLYVARLLSVSSASLIERQRNVCQRLRDEIAADIDIREGIGKLSLQLFLTQIEVILQWLDEIRDEND